MVRGTETTTMQRECRMLVDRERRGSSRPSLGRHARRLLTVAGLAAGGLLLGTAAAHADHTDHAFDPATDLVDEIVSVSSQAADRDEEPGADTAVEGGQDEAAERARASAEIGVGGTTGDAVEAEAHDGEVRWETDEDPAVRGGETRLGAPQEAPQEAELTGEPGDTFGEGDTRAAGEAASQARGLRTVNAVADTAESTLHGVERTAAETLDTVDTVLRTGAGATETVTASLDEVSGTVVGGAVVGDTVSTLEAGAGEVVHHVVTRPMGPAQRVVPAGVVDHTLDLSTPSAPSAQSVLAAQPASAGDAEQAEEPDSAADDAPGRGEDAEEPEEAADLAGGHRAAPAPAEAASAVSAHSSGAGGAEGAHSDSASDTDRGNGSAVGSSSAPVPTAAAGLLITRAELAELAARRIGSSIGAPAELPGATADPTFSPH
jgi:hypothetical protein